MAGPRGNPMENAFETLRWQYIARYGYDGIPKEDLKEMVEILGFSILSIKAVRSADGDAKVWDHKIPTEAFMVIEDGLIAHAYFVPPASGERKKNNFSYDDLMQVFCKQKQYASILIDDPKMLPNNQATVAKKKVRSMIKQYKKLSKQTPSVEKKLRRFLSKGDLSGFEDRVDLFENICASLYVSNHRFGHALKVFPKTLNAAIILSQLCKKRFDIYTLTGRVTVPKYDCDIQALTIGGNKVASHLSQEEIDDKSYAYFKDLGVNVRLISNKALSEMTFKQVFNLYDPAVYETGKKTKDGSQLYAAATKRDDSSSVKIKANLLGGVNAAMRQLLTASIGISLEDIEDSITKANGHRFVRYGDNYMLAENLNELLSAWDGTRDMFIIDVGSKFKSIQRLLDQWCRLSYKPQYPDG